MDAPRKTGLSDRWQRRQDARMRAVGVVLTGRTTIAADMVVRDLLTRLLRRYTDVRRITDEAAAHKRVRSVSNTTGYWNGCITVSVTVGLTQ